MNTAQLNHYHFIRDSLIDYHTILTKRQFRVRCPIGVFMTLEQLELIEQYPPVGGYAHLHQVTERSTTVERLINALLVVGDNENFTVGFQIPHRDIPIVYEAIQETIRLWCYIKLWYLGFETPELDELRDMEKLARYLFSAYKYYKDLNTRRERRQQPAHAVTEYALVNVMMQQFTQGRQDAPEEISFISHIDLYEERITGGYIPPEEPPEPPPTPESQLMRPDYV